MNPKQVCHRLVALILTVAALVSAHAQELAPVTVTSKADSTTLVQGDRTHVTVEIVKNGHTGAVIGLPEKGKDYYGMELSDYSVDSVELGNNRVQLTYHLTFQSFDPAAILTLPAFRYVSGTDTVSSDILTFKVLPVDLDPELGNPEFPDSLKIHPDEPVMAIASRWYDIIPDWTIWVLVGALVAALLFVLYKLYKKNGPKIFVARKPVPPYELAIQRLDALKGKRLIEQGQGKQFYTEVTDIWRQYLQGRFGINAMEMTSSQILKSLRSNNETRLTADQMEQLLQISDFVKFAGLTPTADEMVKAYNTIYSFVESTRPLPRDEAEGTDKTPDKQPQTNKNK